MNRTLLPALLLLTATASAGELVSTQEDQTGLAVTIYNTDLALIKDRRHLRLPPGMTPLAIRGVSGKMRPETALLRSLSHPGQIQVLEQNFNFDLLTPQKMLEKYLGRQVQIVRMNPATGEETRETATILSTSDGLVARIGDRIETNPEGRFIFSDIPENLRDKPTLVTLLRSPTDQPQDLELSYLSAGLSWQADYVAELNGDDSRLDLAGWITLANRSGSSYPGATLQLVAGDVHRVQKELRVARRMDMAYAAAAPAAPVEEEPLFEYHLYTLPRPTTIADNQTKQVALLNAAGVPARKELVLEGRDYYYRRSIREVSQKLKVAVYVEFHNREAEGLGMPLPKGVVRVYKHDRSGRAQFIGEDRIAHTPKNERVRLKLGEAFDVTASRTQTNYQKRTYGHPYSYAAESSFRIGLKNAKSEAVTVLVLEPIPGDWQITKESHPHEKPAAHLAQWKMEIPAESTVQLEYQVLVRY